MLLGGSSWACTTAGPPAIAKPSAAAAMKRWIFILNLLRWGNGKHQQSRGAAREHGKSGTDLLRIRAGQRNPFAFAVIPRAGPGIIRCDIVETDAPEREEVDLPTDAVDLDLPRIRVGEHAIVDLGLPSLDDEPELLRGADVRLLQQAAQKGDFGQPFLFPEWHIEL